MYLSENKIVAKEDYYPFGMLMPKRHYQPDGYRYAFNGKENDNEVKGDGNQQDYGMRIYDPRLGRFLSVDPLTKKYPELTPFQFASNTPIQAIDLDGSEALVKIHYPTGTGSYGMPIMKIDVYRVDGTSFGAYRVLGGIYHMPDLDIKNVENLNNIDGVHDIFVVISTEKDKNSKVLSHLYSAPKKDIDADCEADWCMDPINYFFGDKNEMKTVDITNKETTIETLKKENYDEKIDKYCDHLKENISDNNAESTNEFIQHNDDPGPGPGDEDQ